MTIIPPISLVNTLFGIIDELLSNNPAATESEAYIQHHIEFSLLNWTIIPRYFLRIGINYHGDKVQQIKIDDGNGVLIGWNPTGDALGIGRAAKMLLSGYTIFDRDVDEQLMSDSKIGGGEIPAGSYVRVEFKCRGWLGKTKNLDGKQLEKDIDLLKTDRADLLVICLSETAHKKWRGEGPEHQARRRTGTERFLPILADYNLIPANEIMTRDMEFEGQQWTVATKRVVGNATSIMPGGEHTVTMCWRR